MKYLYKISERSVVTLLRGVDFDLSETILYQRDKRQKLENFESEFNYTFFRYRDRIVKFASTPYFQNGNFKVPRVPLEPRDRFMRI